MGEKRPLRNFVDSHQRPVQLRGEDLQWPVLIADLGRHAALMAASGAWPQEAGTLPRGRRHPLTASSGPARGQRGGGDRTALARESLALAKLVFTQIGVVAGRVAEERSPRIESNDGRGSGPVDASTHAAVVGEKRDAWVLERPKYARHASVPRPPAEERAHERARWRRGKRERAEGWTITPAEAAGMSAAGRRLHGLDDPR